MPRTAAPRPAALPITAHVCMRCGLWLDGDAMAAVSAKLGALRDRAATLAVPPKGALACPRCRVVVGRVQVSGVWIDVCRTCAGVWLDAGEYETLMQAESATARAPVVASASTLGEVRCATCGASAKRVKTYITATGNVCANCYLQAEKAAQQARAVASSESDHTGAAVDAVWIVGAVFEVLEAIIDIADT